MSKNLKEELEDLIKQYKDEIELLKENDNFSDSLKIQSVCILREIVNDLEKLLING